MNMKKIILLILATLSFGITKTSAASDITQGQPGTVCVEGGEWHKETRCFDANDTYSIDGYKWKHIMFNVKFLLTFIGVLIIVSVLIGMYFKDK